MISLLEQGEGLRLGNFVPVLGAALLTEEISNPIYRPYKSFITEELVAF